MTSAMKRPRVSGSDFAALNRRIAEAGLLDRRPAYYAVRMTVVTAIFAGAWAAFVILGESWWQLAVAVLMGVAFSQVGLLAHDVAHGQVFRTRRYSCLVGRIAGNVAVGMSYGWWQEKHTRHHNNPNHDDLDPDVQPEVLIWATHSALGRRGLSAFINRHQAGFFFPLLTLLSLDLRISSVKALRKPGMRRRGLEAGLLALHAVTYLGALALVLTPWQAAAFFVVHQGVFGVYLGMTFAPNHKGMPHPTGDEDYLRKQVLTSRNVTGGRLIDAALGGLNHQIEHHLFPAMPTPNLRRAKPIVRAYCAELGVPYAETGLIESYRQALRYLHEVGEPLRQKAAA
ncbi:putative fatty acid desaturase [Actinoplanes missouriensis 431]|uniref:Putative fatty acid desaturase n=1 Tax=Actinoplanes missouriensis (strain ATCC 14538 / DSM 43046 / CBS 188.64 / JCM 3121 / NBRC 102363 / NCIMB 12654 / NRRL B-3342 / UNCC 431) TaxID=512565 RepID=I0H8A7_ACTM4|nr:acyl-CoA desaturase [Actinoplanes missouriensis]BAL89244.1 putative fatty acid desaturase [Actinoplanes missouriensis 431]